MTDDEFDREFHKRAAFLTTALGEFVDFYKTNARFNPEAIIADGLKSLLEDLIDSFSLSGDLEDFEKNSKLSLSNYLTQLSETEPHNVER